MVILRSLVLTSVLSLGVLLPGCGNNGASPSAEEQTGADIGPNATDQSGADEAPKLDFGSSTDAFLGGGASKTSQTAASKEKGAASPTSSGPRETLEGRWELALHGIGGNLIGVLVDIEQTDEGWNVKTIGQSPLGWTIQDSQIDGNDVKLTVADQAGTTIDFEGTFADGTVKGTLDSGSTGLDVASLRPASRETLTRENFQEPSEDLEKIQSLQNDENLLNNLLQIAKDAGTDPLGYQLYSRILSTVQNQPTQKVDLKELADNYLKSAAPWGERAVNMAELNIAFTLALIGDSSQEALKHLDAAEAGFGEDPSIAVQDRLTLTRGLALVESEETREQGIELLKEIHDENPFNFLATVKLAEVYEEQGNLEDAMAMLAELVAAPSVPADRAKAAEIWKKLGREPQEMETYLDDVYENLVYQFVDEGESDIEVAENQQVVLGEMFTGATCPPCVAADIAIGALETVVPESVFLVLRYHQHIPGPDPMTVSSGQQRRDYYNVDGTPSVFLNGQPIQGTGGFLNNAPAVFASLRQLIAPMLEQTSELEINLTANGDEAGENIRIRAEVQGEEEFPENWRLRMCLVEESIRYPAPNGIRLHEMVVRTMPGGSNGVAPQDGALTYEADIAVDKILTEIQDGINVANQRSNGGLPKLAPQITDLKLVAFVQDDDDQQILQAASIPVSGLAPTTAEKTVVEETPQGDSPPEAAADESPAVPQDEAPTPPNEGE